MDYQLTVTFVILIIALVLFFTDKIPGDLTALLTVVASEPEFRKNLRRAKLELSGKIRTHRVGGRVFMQAQLHVRTDIRKTWISSNYPNGAVPISVQLGSDPLPGVWGPLHEIA